MNREQILALADSVGHPEQESIVEDGKAIFHTDELVAFFHAAQALAYENAAKVCEALTEGFAVTSVWDESAMRCAAAIRALKGESK